MDTFFDLFFAMKQEQSRSGFINTQAQWGIPQSQLPTLKK